MASSWQIGSRIDNRWQVHDIQQGSSGLVYMVYDHELHLPYAVKTFQEAVLARHPGLVERFSEAAQAWVALGAHANVTRAHFVKQVEGQPLLFLTYLGGGDLRDWVGIQRLLDDLPQILRFALQCCDGLLHAAAHGIPIHGNLRPQNCLITPHGTLQVTDFGLARLLDEADAAQGTTLSRVEGPLHISMYMAPEQFTDPRQADVRADIYAFGILLFHMLAGKVPFGAPTWQEIAACHRTQPLPQLHTEDVLREIVETCLAKDPAQRFATFQPVRERLAALYTTLTGTPLPPPIVGPEYEIIEWSHIATGLGAIGRPEEALPWHDRILERSPEDPQAWVDRASTLEAVGQLDDAMAACDKALAINDRHEQALVNKAIILGARGEIEEARTCCDLALKVNPRNEQAWLNIGVALDALGQQMDSLACYNNVLTLNPRNEQAWFNTSVVLSAMGRHEEALGCCNRALALNPRNEQAWMNKGLTLLEMQRPEEALNCLDQTLRLDPQLAQAWFNKGVILVNGLKRHTDALLCFEQAQRLGHTQAAEGIAFCKEELR